MTQVILLQHEKYHHRCVSLVSKNPYDLGSEIRFRILPKKLLFKWTQGLAKNEISKPIKTPKKDYFVMTRQGGGTQYIYQNDISLVLP